MPAPGQKAELPTIPALVPGVDLRRADEEQPMVDAAAHKLYEATLPSIVRVGTNKGVGTGFFIDNKGTIATDAHVVLDSEEQFAITSDGKRRRLRIDRIDDVHDLAIMRPVEPMASKPLEIGSSGGLRFADPIWAIGNPKGLPQVYISPGEYHSPSTPLDVFSAIDPYEAGRISAKLAAAKDPDFTAYYSRRLLGADIHVEHGNSGGPVVDRSGRVIGLVDMGIPEEGIGYMTPAEKLTDLQRSSPKFRFNYEYQPAAWANSYVNAWHERPGNALLATGTFAGLAGLGTAAMYRYPHATGGISTLTGIAMLESDYEHWKNYESSRDSWKYGLALGADTSTLLGGIAMLALKKKTYGMSMVGAGIAGRLATDFIPNHYVRTTIDRLDGKKTPIIGFKHYLPGDDE